MAVRTAALALGVPAVVLLVAGCAAPATIPPGATDAEARRFASQAVADYWQWLGPDLRRELPPIELVAFTTPSTWAAAQVDCLRAAGVPARELNGGLAIDSVAGIPADDVLDSRMTCMAQYPVDPRDQGYLSDAQVLYMYDYFVRRLVPCLRLLGYDVAAPPDRNAYLDTVRTGFSWNPYRLAQGPLGATEWQLINAECPPLPADPYSHFQPPAAG